MARDGERVSTLTVGYEPQAVSFHPTQPEVAIGGKVHSNRDIQLHIIHLYTYIIFHKSVKMLATRNFCGFGFLWFCSSVVLVQIHRCRYGSLFYVFKFQKTYKINGKLSSVKIAISPGRGWLPK